MSRWERLFCAVNPKVERLNNQGLSPTHPTWTSRPRGWLWSSPWLENHVWWKLPRPVAPPPGPQVPESRVDRLAKKVHGQHKPTVRGCRLQVTHALSFPAHWPEMATCPHQGARCLVSVRKHVDRSEMFLSAGRWVSVGYLNLISPLPLFHYVDGVSYPYSSKASCVHRVSLPSVKQRINSLKLEWLWPSPLPSALTF